MQINYPETIIEKSSGSNESESYLSKVCERAFLSLWSYPNVYRDQGRKKSNDGQLLGDGKELCDLLVVFENHILIFSDKNCVFTTTEDVKIAWIRWYKRAISNSAKQIFGAERWLFDHSNSIYLDKLCKNRFPIVIPPKNVSKIHRIAIAHGISEHCKEYFGDVSGSLFIDNQIFGNQHIDSENCEPFRIGIICPEEGFVHVFDDYSLDIVMNTLDTITDFTDYLVERERFLLQNKKILIAGEEDLLALFLTSTGIDGKKNFNEYSDNQKYAALVINQGQWRNYISSSLYTRLMEANKISYIWDGLVEKFLYHLATGTSQYLSDPYIIAQEKLFRVLASENRMCRRILSTALYNLITKTQPNQSATTIIAPLTLTSPAYLFLVFDFPKSLLSYDEYRQIRRSLLSDHLEVAMHQYRDFRKILGIATEPIGEYCSEDVALLSSENWTKDDYQRAAELEEEMFAKGLLNKRAEKREKIFEYPKE